MTVWEGFDTNSWIQKQIAETTKEINEIDSKAK